MARRKKHPGGRPRESEDGAPRSEVLKLRLSETEKENYKTRARVHGFDDVSDFVRAAVKESKMRKISIDTGRTTERLNTEWPIVHLIVEHPGTQSWIVTRDFCRGDASLGTRVELGNFRQAVIHAACGSANGMRFDEALREIARVDPAAAQAIREMEAELVNMDAIGGR